MASTDVVEWELVEPSKENMKPLRQGRTAKSMKQAVTVAKTTVHTEKQLSEKRAEYEAAIKAYDGEDPLVPYLSYIAWTQQMYMAAGNKSCLIPLLEECTRKFKDDERYKHNLRFLRVWMTYADAVEKPLDVFQFMEANDIGTTHATFYHSWAAVLEDRNNVPKADEILSLGIARKASPIGRLQSALRGVRARVAKKVMNDVANNTTTSFTAPTQSRSRMPLGMINKKRRARLVDPQDRGLSMTRPKKKISPNNGSSSGGFAIFCDDDAPATSSTSMHPPVRASAMSSSSSSSTAGGGLVWNDFGSQANQSKENRATATTWNAPLAMGGSSSRSRREGSSSSSVDGKIRRRSKQARGSSITVFVDEELVQKEVDVKSPTAKQKLSALSLRKRLDGDIEKINQNPVQNMQEDSAGQAAHAALASQVTTMSASYPMVDLPMNLFGNL